MTDSRIEAVLMAHDCQWACDMPGTGIYHVCCTANVAVQLQEWFDVAPCEETDVYLVIPIAAVAA